MSSARISVPSCTGRRLSVRATQPAAVTTNRLCVNPKLMATAVRPPVDDVVSIPTTPAVVAAPAAAPVHPMTDCLWCALYTGQYPYSRALLWPSSEYPTNPYKIIVADVPNVDVNACLCVIPYSHVGYSSYSSNTWLQKLYRVAYDAIQNELGSFDDVTIVSTNGPDSTNTHYGIFFVFNTENVTQEQLTAICDAVTYCTGYPASGYTLPTVNTTLAIHNPVNVASAAPHMAAVSRTIKRATATAPLFTKSTNPSSTIGCRSAIDSSSDNNMKSTFSVVTSVNSEKQLVVEVVPHDSSSDMKQAIEQTKHALSSLVPESQISMSTQKDTSFLLNDVSISQYQSLLHCFQTLNLNTSFTA